MSDCNFEPDCIECNDTGFIDSDFCHCYKDRIETQ